MQQHRQNGEVVAGDVLDKILLEHCVVLLVHVEGLAIDEDRSGFDNTRPRLKLLDHCDPSGVDMST